MKKHSLAVGFLLLLASVSHAGKKKPDSPPIFPEVTARGRALYEYDQAAWHATDAVRATNPPVQLLARYIARKSEMGWAVAFGRISDTGDAFLVACEAMQGPDPQTFTVKRFDPSREDRSFNLSAARAIDTALRDFRGQNRPYNVAVLPAQSNQLFVYVYPAPARPGVYPLGGDARYVITADGTTIVERRQLHKGIIENRGQLPPGATLAGGVHTHILSDVPEDTDVFFVLTRKPAIPEMIGTSNRKFYEVDPDGTIRAVKM